MPEIRFCKGDRVRFGWGLGTVQGVVKEDRGPIGINGRRLYAVEFLRGRDDLTTAELPAADLEKVEDVAATG